MAQHAAVPQPTEISPASVRAIQRSVLTLENEGADKFFGEPSFDIFDLLQCRGQGIMNVLAPLFM